MRTLDEVLKELRLSHDPYLPDYPALATDLASHKKAALQAGDEGLAKHIWCLEHTVEVQRLYLKAFQELKERKYFEAWCTLEQVKLGLGRLRRHFEAHWEECRLAFIEKITSTLQKLYPYKLFASPELLEISKSCTICGKRVSIRNHCGHDVGEIYNGEYCGRRVDESKILGVAMVRDPLQKYSVAFLTDPKTGQRVDHYNYATVEYLAKRWPTPYADWSAEWTQRLHPKSKFGQVGRNDKCPCESGKKYKKCCMNLNGIMRPHIIFEFSFPIPQELQTTEYSY